MAEAEVKCQYQVPETEEGAIRTKTNHYIRPANIAFFSTEHVDYQGFLCNKLIIETGLLPPICYHSSKPQKCNLFRPIN